MTSGASEPVVDTDPSGHSAYAFHLIDQLKRNRNRRLRAGALHERLYPLVPNGQAPLLGHLASHQEGAEYVFVKKGHSLPVPSSARPRAVP